MKLRCRRILKPALLGACALLATWPALANPTLPQVVNGRAEIVRQGKVLTITNSNGAVINWSDFSIRADELTRFVQPGADSSVLNRVVGPYGSEILGTLQSNGRVFLINPNGILFGAGSRVDVQGLVASTLDIGNADFAAGRLRFQGTPEAGRIDAQGTITTPRGGRVFLLASGIEQRGLIQSPEGEVLLAAGHRVELVDSADPNLHVVLAAPADRVLNLGRVIAQGGRIGLYGALVEQRGIVNADSAVRGADGRIVLKASRRTTLEDGSLTSATQAAGRGGEVLLQGPEVVANGHATVDVSGSEGGGALYVGGGFHGGDRSIVNAGQVFLGRDTQLRADATRTGDGGRVIVWSDVLTQAWGGISARSAAGRGGLVEVSSARQLAFGAHVSTAGARGHGTLLLDPETLEIRGGEGDGNRSRMGPGDGPATFNGGQRAGEILADSGLTVVYQSEIEALGVDNDIVLEAANLIRASGTFSTPLTLGPDSKLTLRTRNQPSHGDAAGGTLGIDLTTSANGAGLELKTQGSGSITLQTSGAGGWDAPIRVGRLSSERGAITLQGRGEIDLQGSIRTGGGSVTLEAMGDNSLLTLRPGTSIATTGGALDLMARQMALQGSLSTGAAGQVRLAPPSDAPGRDIVLGDGPAPDALLLSPQALDTIQTPRLLLDTGGSLAVETATALGQASELQLSASHIAVDAPLALSSADARLVLNTQGLDLAAAVDAGNGQVVISPLAPQAGLQLGQDPAVVDANRLVLTAAGLRQVSAAQMVLGDPSAGWQGELTVAGGGLDLRGGRFGGDLRLHSATGVSLDGVLKAPGALAVVTDGLLGASAGSGLQAGAIVLQADRMRLGGAAGSIDSGSGSIQLLPRQGQWAIELGGSGATDEAPRTLELSAPEIASLAGSGSLRFGSLGEPAVSAIRVVGPVGTTFPSLSLAAAGPIGQDAGAAITAPRLAVQALGDVSLEAANAVGEIAAAVGDAGHLNRRFSFRSAQALAVAQVDGVNGIAIARDAQAWDALQPAGDIALASGGALTQQAGALLDGAALYAEGTRVTLTEANPTRVLAGRATGGAPDDAFRYTARDDLRLGTVAGHAGVSQAGAAGGDVAVWLRTGAGGGLTQEADAPLVTAGALRVDSGGAIDLSTATGNRIGAFGAVAGGPVALAVAGDLDIGCGSLGITSGGSDIQFTAAGQLTLRQGVDAGAGAVSLGGASLQLGSAATGGVTVSGGRITLAALAAMGSIRTAGGAASVGSADTTQVLLQADRLDFSEAPAVFSARAADGQVQWRPTTPGVAMTLDDRVRAEWKAATVSFGSETAGDLTIAAPVAVAHRLALLSGATVRQSAALAADELVVLAGAAALEADNRVSTIVARTGGGDFSLRNTGALRTGQATIGGSTHVGIATHGGAVTLDNTGALDLDAAVDAGAGAIHLATHSPLTVNAPVSAGGDITLEAGASGSRTDTLTVTRQGSVVSSGGNVLLKAGETIELADGASVRAAGSVQRLDHRNLPSLSQCIVQPALTGCGEVLPTLQACAAQPTLPGCVVVLPPLANCIANPATPGCSVVLPSLAACMATPALPGCAVVLPTLAACIATPSLQGCSIVLPSLSACIASPASPGCSVVLPSLGACTAAPSVPGCAAVLPTLVACIAAPATPGCVVVLPRPATCIANPATPGCSVVLPSLAACMATPTLPGCAVVLPTLAACIATPSLQGCSVVLPSLGACTAAPSVPGCAAVLPTLVACIAAPATPGCVVVLPRPATCIANPATPGCSVVLPSLAACMATPTLPGCAVVLPTLAACIATPSLQGCSVVLPTVEACVAQPALPGCAVVLPPTAGTGGDSAPVAKAVDSTVQVINSAGSATSKTDTPAPVDEKSGKSTATTAPDKTTSDQTATPDKTTGAAKDEPAKKLYCN